MVIHKYSKIRNHNLISCSNINASKLTSTLHHPWMVNIVCEFLIPDSSWYGQMASLPSHNSTMKFFENLIMRWWNQKIFYQIQHTFSEKFDCWLLQAYNQEWQSLYKTNANISSSVELNINTNGWHCSWSKLVVNWQWQLWTTIFYFISFYP